MKQLVALLFLLLVAPAASAGVRAPLDAAGGLRFVADLPVFPVAHDRGRIDLAVRVDHDQIEFRREGDRLRGRLVLDLKLAREGRVAVDTTQVYEIFAGLAPEGAEAVRRFELLELSALAPVGKWAATVEVRDAADPSRRGRATGVVEVLRWTVGEVRLSDAQFRLRAGGEDAQLPLPNPERLYGVVQDTLVVYLELRGGAPTEALTVRVEVFDPTYGGMDEQTIVLRPERDPAAALYRLPLASFPAGTYVLRLLPGWVDDVVLEYDFTVSWRVERAVQARDDLRMEAELVLSAAEFEDFERLSRAVQAERMQDFWDAVDPTPGTPRNETLERFQARVAHARRHYGEFGTVGPLSDRGRVYVRYGEPAEVRVEVLPTNGSDLEEAIGAVHDAHAVELDGVIAREQENKESILGLQRAGRNLSDPVLQDRLRNQARIGQEGSFELWVYRLDGDPLLPTLGHWSENVDLRFLFVDRGGNGVYRLDFTNLPTRY